MKIQRAFKVRIYPTDEQRVFLNKTLGYCRFLYNHMLHERIEIYESLKDDYETLYVHKYKTEKDYKQEYDFLKKADAFALQQARRNLESAYSHFYQPRCGTTHDHDMNAAINLRRLGVSIPVQCGELTSMNMGALALGNIKSEPLVERPVTGRSRKLVEQAEQSAQATSPCL